MAQGSAPSMSALRQAGLVAPGSRGRFCHEQGCIPLLLLIPLLTGRGHTGPVRAEKHPRVLDRRVPYGAAHSGWAVTVRFNGTGQADGVLRVPAQPAPYLRIAGGADNTHCDSRSYGPPSARPDVIVGNKNTLRKAGCRGTAGREQ